MRVYSKKFLAGAAKDQGIKPAQGKQYLAEMPVDFTDAIKAHLEDAAFTEGETLEDLRKAFPSLFTGDDARDGFLVRVAVGSAGGMAV